MSDAVYASLAEAANVGGAVVPLPSYELYKTAREEELTTFRGVCRAVVMHHGKDLPKGLRRVLGDLREELCVSKERAALERHLAEQDAVVQAVRASGILTRRGDFYDGTDDVPLPTAAKRARDDGAAVCTAPSTKVAKAEVGQTTAVTAPSPAATARRKRPQAALLTAISKVGKEVEQSSSELLHATDPSVVQRTCDSLTRQRSVLLQLQQEIRDAATPVEL